MSKRTFGIRSVFTSYKSALFLLVLSAGIFSMTAFAAASTFEVIAERDMPISNALRSVDLTSDAAANKALMSAYGANYAHGSFGLPAKIRLPEASKHITISHALLQDGQWKASSTHGHVLLTADARQKMFGQAVIYLRVNTATTQDLGEVLVGDTYNIVTTDGWQLGYTVSQRATSYADVMQSARNDVSTIVLILIDDPTNKTTYYRAELTKVGERL